MDYKISVLGEVTKPGTYDISNEKVNVFQALALAGDLTIFETNAYKDNAGRSRWKTCYNN